MTRLPSSLSTSHDRNDSLVNNENDSPNRDVDDERNDDRSYHDNESDDNNNIRSPLHYFVYGPLVHPLVRERRGIEVIQVQAAVLRDYRLTFGMGGMANVVPQTGYDVHGVLLQCSTPEDGERLQEVGYSVVTRPVYPYHHCSSSCHSPSP